MTDNVAAPRDETLSGAPAASRKALVFSIVGVVTAVLIHPLIAGIAAGFVAWLAKPLSRRARLIFAVLAPLLFVFGVFFSFIPFGLG